MTVCVALSILMGGCGSAVVVEEEVRLTEVAAVVDVQAERGIPQQAATPPYAPEGLSGCDEMNWYRVAVGLPEIFSKLGWRESNCRNEDGVRTFCCHGYWQLYTSLHLQDHRLAPLMLACGVSSSEDVNSDTPEDKLRQACAAKALYDIEGTDPWRATR